MKTQEKELAVFTAQENEDIVKLLDERRTIKALLEEAEARIKAIDSEIKEFMSASNAPSAIIGDHKVTVSQYVKESVSAEKVKGIISESLFETIVTRTLVTRLIVK